MPPVRSHADVVTRLMEQYSGGIMFAGECLKAEAGGMIFNNGYMGSRNIVELKSLDSIIHQAPGCVAAAVVNMTAAKSIKLGAEGQGDQAFPVRIYASARLSMQARHLVVGDLDILVEPLNAILSCDKLTLIQSDEEEPRHFEMIKSWASNDDMEIEVIKKSK